MDATVLTLKILAVYLVVSGLFLVLKGKTVPHLLKDFFDHQAVVYLTGIILIFLSTMYLIQYHVLDGDRLKETVVTLFVWLVGIKGLVYVFMPKYLSEGLIKKSRNMFGVYGIVAIVAGLYIFTLQ